MQVINKCYRRQFTIGIGNLSFHLLLNQYMCYDYPGKLEEIQKEQGISEVKENGEEKPLDVEDPGSITSVTTSGTEDKGSSLSPDKDLKGNVELLLESFL